jgi:Wiskott-Aldrich syndrome protein
MSSQRRDSSIPGPSIRKQQTQDDGPRQLHQPAPAFRTGGWSSIDSTTRIPPPPQTLPSDVPKPAMADTHRQSEHRPSGPTSAPTPLPSVTVPAAVPLPLPVPPRPQASNPNANADAQVSKPSKSKKEREAEIRENSRSGWQSFQKGGRRK